MCQRGLIHTLSYVIGACSLYVNANSFSRLCDYIRSQKQND